MAEVMYRGTLTCNKRGQTIRYTAETKQRVIDRFAKIIREIELDAITIKIRKVNELT